MVANKMCSGSCGGDTPADRFGRPALYVGSADRLALLVGATDEVGEWLRRLRRFRISQPQ